MNILDRLATRITQSIGIEVHRVPKTGMPPIAMEYTRIFPSATYSPWNVNKPFQSIYATIKQHTLVDEYRCYELWELVRQSSKLSKGDIIEIGVWRGGTGALLAAAAVHCGLRQTIFLCDTFTGVVKAGPEDSVYKGGEHADTTRQVVQELIYDRMHLDNISILEGVFPEDTAKRLDSRVFRFCHIDVDVYKSAKDTVNWVWSRMVPGGIVVFDDYGTETCPGITSYIREQQDSADRLVIYNLNGHAIFVKL